MLLGGRDDGVSVMHVLSVKAEEPISMGGRFGSHRGKGGGGSGAGFGVAATKECSKSHCARGGIWVCRIAVSFC